MPFVATAGLLKAEIIGIALYTGPMYLGGHFFEPFLLRTPPCSCEEAECRSGSCGKACILWTDAFARINLKT